MSSRHHPPFTWQRLVLAVALLLCSGGLHSVFGQILPGESGVSRPTRAPNPRTNINRITGKRPDNRAKQTASNLPHASPDTRPDAKQQAIEQAIEQGNQARDVNAYEQALANYQKAQMLNSQEARAFYGMGNVYSDLYCADSAIEAYLKALEFKKDYLEALIGLGYAYVGKERYDDAREKFQAALKLTPHKISVEANIGLGHIYAKTGKYEEAIAQINHVISAQSIEGKDRAAAHIALGGVYWKQDKRQEAIAQFEKAISLKPDLARAYIELGNAQLLSAFSKLSGLVISGLKEAGIQEREALHASAKQATANIESARERGYNHPNLYEFLGMSLAYQFRYQDAVTQINIYFDKVKELEHRLPALTTQCDSGFSRLNADGYFYLGFVYYLEGDFEADDKRKTELLNKAIEQFNQAIKLKQDYAPAYGMLGNIYFARNKYEEAISQYQKDLLYTTEESSKAQKYESIGLAYSKLGRDDEAIRHVREAIKRNPNNPSSYESLASIYVKQDKIEETLDALKKATELRKELPTNPGPYHYLGVTYAIRFMKKRNEKDFDEAVRLLKQAVEIRPNVADYYYALGITYKAHGDADEALAYYRKAVQYNPKNPSYYFDMAQIYSDLKRNYDAAIYLLTKAIELKPDYAMAYREWGVIYYRKNNHDEAIKQLRKAIELDPKLLGAYLDLGNIYRIQRNYPEAIKYLNKATEIAPTDFYPYKELAKVYEAQQKNEDAIRYYEEAMKRLSADDSSTKNLYLGRIARLKGQYAEAIEYFRKVNFPDEPGQPYYEIGVTYVVSKNKQAALEQHQQLVQLKSTLAEELLKKIKEMK